MAPPSKTDPVTTYAQAVVAGTILVGKLVRLAAERHLRDLGTGPARGLRWDAVAALRAIEFFGFLRHSKGEWAGKPLTLEPWQQFIVGCLFGWKREDGTRRFRMNYGEIARKNGKSTLAAGVALLLAFFSGEPGAEVYCAATKRDQARIVHGEAVRMRRASPYLAKRIAAAKDNLHVIGTASRLEPLGADAYTADGLNVSGAIVDELHAHPTRELLDVLETATGSRREPLIFIITTAGVAGRPTVCREMHDYAARVLEGQVEDDTLFAFVAALDEGDDWRDEACWPKANPNLGVSVKLDDLRRKRDKAVEMPSAQATFRQKHCNEWVQSAEVWLPDDRWMLPANAAPVDAEALAGRESYGALDLANTLDLCAHVQVFPRGESRTEELPGGEVAEGAPKKPVIALAESYDVLAWFWVPEAAAAERERTNRVTYRHWIAEGWITETDGDVTDYDVIRADLVRLAGVYGLRKLAYDPFNATQLANQLTLDGLSLERFQQNIASYTEPMIVLEKLIRDGRLRHGGNPVLRWMVGNVVAHRDGLGRAMPSRKKSTDKIDGVAALLMALAGAILRPAQPPGKYYEDHPLEFA